MKVLVYSEDELKGKYIPRISYSEQNATRMFLNHYENYLYLDFIAKNNRSSFAEKAQARKELIICERKMNFWKRHPNFNVCLAESGALKLKSQWK